jgi:threonine 3-dehydrogenase
LGNAVHSAFRCKVPTNNVVVFGVGPIGLLSVAVCKAIGAGQVIAVGRKNKYRVDLAKKLGADHAILSSETNAVDFVKEKTGGRGADVVLESAGEAQAITDCLRMLRQGGELSLLGVFGDNSSIDLSKDVVFRYANIYGINGRLMWDTWYRMAGLFKSGKFDIAPVITHSYKFDDFEKAMEKMMSGQSGKVVLTLGK